MSDTELAADKAEELYREMYLIRYFEDRVHEVFIDGELPGFLHLCSGQEASAVGVIAHLRKSDAITSTHRNHGHALAKGASPVDMMLELYGRDHGSNNAKGGSMHIAAPEVGHFASGGIVGASAPLALGPALAFKLQGEGNVAVAFFGDGGAQQGTVLESMNLAKAWELPVIFVCENNNFGQATPVSYASASAPFERAKGFGLPSEKVDGQDVLAVYEAAGAAVRRAREGGGPSFLQCETYSYHGAWEGEPKRTYRLPELDLPFRERDPLVLLDAHLSERSVDWLDRKLDIEERAEQIVEDAIDAGRRGEIPSTDVVTQGVYADRGLVIDSHGLAIHQN